VALLANGAAWAGIIFELQRGNEPPVTMSIEGARMRIDTHRRGGLASTVLLDGAGKRMTILNDADHTYLVLTDQDMKEMRERARAALQTLRESLKDMPAEERKQAEAALAANAVTDGPPGTYKFERKAGKKTINGFSCETYVMTIDGKPREEVCVSPWGAGLFTKADFASLGRLFDEMAKNPAASGGGGRDLLAALDKEPGFPVSRVALGDGGARDAAEQLKSFKRGALPAATFVVPPGYVRKDLPATLAPRSK
jgi:hypothetical protein